MPVKKIELSDTDISSIRLMVRLGLNIPEIAAMLRDANKTKISARTLSNLKRTDPRVTAAFQWAAGRSNLVVAKKLYSIAINPKTDPGRAFRACKYWESTRGGRSDPQRRSVQHQEAEPGRVVIQD